MSKVISTTAQEVAATFATRGRAQREFRRWHGNPDQVHVVRRVMRHRSEAVYAVTPEQVLGVASEHPLKRVRPARGYGVKAVKDWRPDFAFSHLFHFCLEEYGRPFSFQEFRAHSEAPENEPLLWGPAKQLVQRVVAEGTDQQAAQDAMTWRVGLAYYSFLRELYVLARLREAGLDMRVHPLADALFRADAWFGSTVLCLYVRNDEFRNSRAGRKPPAADILGDGQDCFRFVDLGMNLKRTFGVVHLPSDDEIRSCAAEIRRSEG